MAIEQINALKSGVRGPRKGVKAREKPKALRREEEARDRGRRDRKMDAIIVAVTITPETALMQGKVARRS